MGATYAALEASLREQVEAVNWADNVEDRSLTTVPTTATLSTITAHGKTKIKAAFNDHGKVYAVVREVPQSTADTTEFIKGMVQDINRLQREINLGKA